MKGIKAFLLSSLMILLYCCNSHNFVDSSHPVDKQNLKFSASIDNDSLATRKQDNSWEKGDAIGLFSYESGKPYHEGTVDSELLNRKFIYNESGFFTPSEGQVSYPTTKRDLFAYYPYLDQQDVVKDFTYVVNLADQSDLDKIDLLYSNNLKDFEEGVRSELKFTHVLSRLNLNVISKEYDLTAAEVKLIGLHTKADFNLLSGKIYVDEKVISEVPITAHSTNSSLSFSALVLPTQQPQDIKVVITLKDGTPFTWKVPSAWTWESGKKYTKTIQLSPEGTVTPDPTPSEFGYFETPLINKDNLPNNIRYVVKMLSDKNPNAEGNQRNYEYYYDIDHKISYWVAYPLCNYYTQENVKRQKGWYFDPALDEKYQVDLNDIIWSKINYDRGHQIASSDRVGSREMNHQTFLSPNVTPQYSNLNQKIWNHLEQKVQAWSGSVDTLYVVTGAGFFEGKKIEKAPSKTNSNPEASIPHYYYKVLAKKVGAEYFTIGFLLDHHNKYYAPDFTGSNNFMDYKKPVSEIEKLTGFTFFPGLPDTSVKEQIVADKWK